jgi:hypothetical protein
MKQVTAKIMKLSEFVALHNPRVCDGTVDCYIDEATTCEDEDPRNYSCEPIADDDLELIEYPCYTAHHFTHSEIYSDRWNSVFKAVKVHKLPAYFVDYHLGGVPIESCIILAHKSDEDGMLFKLKLT